MAYKTDDVWLSIVHYQIFQETCNPFNHLLTAVINFMLTFVFENRTLVVFKIT
jgi:hypothetical protein